MIRDIEQVRSIAAMFDNVDDGVVDDDDVADTDDADAIDGDDNDVDDTAAADRDDVGGADDDEPARQQADGIDTYGERREAEREPTAPPAVGDQQPEDAPPAGRTPSLTPASESGQRRGVLPRRNSPGRSADVQPAPPQPGRRRRGPAGHPGKMRGGPS